MKNATMHEVRCVARNASKCVCSAFPDPVAGFGEGDLRSGMKRAMGGKGIGVEGKEGTEREKGGRGGGS